MYMNSKNKILTSHSINYWSELISFSLIQTNRKTFRVEVLPNMEVLVKAPIRVSKDTILDRVKKRAGWILEQIAYFEDFYPRITPRKYISWETFLYLWKQYILKIEIVKNKEWIKLKWKFMIANVLNKKNTENVINNWYTQNAKEKFNIYIYPVLDTFKKHNIYPNDIRIRKMLTRWWSCSRKWNITLNSELVKASRWCIEYVLTHECCHLVEFWHTKKFYELQTTVMPDWQKWKNKLERLLA